MAIATVNPANGQTVETFDSPSDEEIDGAIGRAHDAFLTLRGTSFAERAEWMRAAAAILDEERAEVAAMMTTEMGKTLASAEGEAAKCALACRFYADHAERFMAAEPADAIAVKASHAEVRYQPLGPVLAVMPWNFPLWQAMRFAAPALMAGNTGLLKHASNVPRTALYMQRLFERAGFPRGAFETLLISASRVERVLSDDRVVAATLTGSEGAGRSVAAIAGRELKKMVLELGGSDPFVVLPSADIAAAARTATIARVQNNGQSCIAAKRFIVHTDVYDEFAEAFVSAMSALVVGDPTDRATHVGPLALEQGVTDTTELVDDALAKGATALCGGARLDGAGWYFPPTVIADITPDMRIFREEVFAPVASLYRASNAEQALSLANATAFGLGSNVWTNDAAEREMFIDGLVAGGVFVNGMTTSYPELPFGGVGLSGYGRELSSHGIREFCNTKTVWVA